MQLIKSAEHTVTKFEIVTLVCGSTKSSEKIEVTVTDRLTICPLCPP